MASKRRQRRKQCGDKIPHSHQTAVQEAIRRSRAAGAVEVFDAYPCPVCGAWHVGHRPKFVRQQIEARRRA